MPRIRITRGRRTGVVPVEDENEKLERIRKLLAKAEKAGTPEEAEIYNEKAVELMNRHLLRTAELAYASLGEALQPETQSEGAATSAEASVSAS